MATVKQVAAILGVSTDVVTYWCRFGVIRGAVNLVLSEKSSFPAWRIPWQEVERLKENLDVCIP